MSKNGAMTITEFLEARIAEDELTARLVADGPGRTEKSGYWPVRIGLNGEDATFAHVGAHPNRILAECLVKRGVLTIHADGGPSQGWTDDGYGVIDHACVTCGEHGEYGVEWPCDTTKVLAAAYMDHADYQAQWVVRG